MIGVASGSRAQGGHLQVMDALVEAHHGGLYKKVARRPKQGAGAPRCQADSPHRDTGGQSTTRTRERARTRAPARTRTRTYNHSVCKPIITVPMKCYVVAGQFVCRWHPHGELCIQNRDTCRSTAGAACSRHKRLQRWLLDTISVFKIILSLYRVWVVSRPSPDGLNVRERVVPLPALRLVPALHLPCARTRDDRDELLRVLHCTTRMRLTTQASLSTSLCVLPAQARTPV